MKYRYPNRERIWRENHKEHVSLYMKNYTQANAIELKEYKKNYYQKNKTRLQGKNKKWRKDNHQDLLLKKRRYNKMFSKHRVLYSAIYQQKRRKTDLDFLLRINLSSRTRLAIKNQSTIKTGKTKDLLGLPLNEVRKYIESKFSSGMSWKTYGLRGWHIDHIKPLSLFDLTKEEEQKKAFHYTNLQPLWAFDNLSKGNKYV